MTHAKMPYTPKISPHAARRGKTRTMTPIKRERRFFEYLTTWPENVRLDWENVRLDWPEDVLLDWADFDTF